MPSRKGANAEIGVQRGVIGSHRLISKQEKPMDTNLADNPANHSATLPTVLPRKLEGASLRRALNDRVTFSEALQAAGRIVKAYPNGGKDAGEGYIGALAATLAAYPRVTATQCASPVFGVVRVASFLPTVAEIVKWCEKAVEPLYRQADREDRVTAQIDARAMPIDAVTRERVAAGFKSLGEALQRGLKPSPAELEARAEKATNKRARHLRDVVAEWEAAGEPAPTIGGVPISRELLDQLRREREAQD
jgi:hypothetical protein